MFTVEIQTGKMVSGHQTAITDFSGNVCNCGYVTSDFKSFSVGAYNICSTLFASVTKEPKDGFINTQSKLRFHVRFSECSHNLILD